MHLKGSIISIGSLCFVIAHVVHCLLQFSLKQFGRIDEPLFGFAKTVWTAASNSFPTNVPHFHSATILAISHKDLDSRGSEEQLIPGLVRNFFLILATVVTKHRRNWFRSLLHHGFRFCYTVTTGKREFNSKVSVFV